MTGEMTVFTVLQNGQKEKIDENRSNRKTEGTVDN